MGASDSLRNLAKNAGFRPSRDIPYIEQRKYSPRSNIIIIDEPDGSFYAVCYSGIDNKTYEGRFGIKGGKKNYGARRIVEILLQLQRV